jgi:hypothetical protein
VSDDDWREDPDPEPPSLGPEVPEVDVPEVKTSDSVTGDGDSETARLFWRLVVVLDVGLLALAVGPMFVYFEGDWRRGLALVAFGIVVILYAVVRYRRYREESETDDDATATEPGG